MARVLIIYSTTDGHTLAICQRLRQVIEQHQHQVTLVSINDAVQSELRLFDKIIIGASIRYGRHRPQVYRFIKENSPILNSKANAFFTVNVVARKPNKNQPATNPYLQKFLHEITWRPKQLAVFAGKIDYPKYKFWDRLIIRLIMWITNGPVEANSVVDFTNWNQVDNFAHRVSEM